MKQMFSAVFAAFVLFSSQLSAHCQMPCGIYDDQLVYDQVDQYYLTMYKAVSALKNSKFETLHDRNQYIRWVMLKNEESDTTAKILTTYFLQQKITPMAGDADTQKLVHSIHQLLFYLVIIKQNVDLDIVKQFGKEWENFKQMFHPEADQHPLFPSPSSDHDEKVPNPDEKAPHKGHVEKQNPFTKEGSKS